MGVWVSLPVGPSRSGGGSGVRVVSPSVKLGAVGQTVTSVGHWWGAAAPFFSCPAVRKG